MWIEASKVYKRYAYYLHIKLSILRISFSFVEIMRVQVSIGYMDFMTKLSEGITLDYGKHSLNALTVYPSVR